MRFMRKILCWLKFHRWRAWESTLSRLDAFTADIGNWPGGWVWQEKCDWCGKHRYTAGVEKPKRIGAEIPK